jgi:hypothetical protein
MKKIEAGCLAMVINSVHNNGKIVTVIENLGRLFPTVKHDYWRFDAKFDAFTRKDNKPIGKKIDHCPEYQLMRIDGFDEDEQQTKDVMLKLKSSTH